MSVVPLVGKKGHRHAWFRSVLFVETLGRNVDLGFLHCVKCDKVHPDTSTAAIYNSLLPLLRSLDNGGAG